MARNLDSSLAAALSNGLISPVIFAALTLAGGPVYVWSGVGNFVFNGNTYVGVGSLGKLSPINEGSSVKADGVTLQLSGLPLLSGPPLPSGLTPPVALGQNQYVAWTTPGAAVASGFPSADYSSTQGWGQSVVANTSGGTMQKSGNDSIATTWVQIEWSDFSMPQLPPDAVVQAIYPVIIAHGYADTYPLWLNFSTTDSPQVAAGSGNYSGEFYVDSIGNAIPNGYSVSEKWSFSSAYSGGKDYVNFTYVGLAVYYTSSFPNTANAPSYLDDLTLGGPAQIWFGLLSEGTLVGTPYLVFSGQVDQPEIDIDTDTAIITIALENRLVNLARATQRRYTSADQHIAYPDDIGFNWVEILNDMALRWGMSNA